MLIEQATVDTAVKLFSSSQRYALKGTNTLAYLASSSVMMQKRSIPLTPGVNVIKLVSFIADNEAK